jgi:hypothetical protein
MLTEYQEVLRSGVVKIWGEKDVDPWLAEVGYFPYEQVFRAGGAGNLTCR